MSTPADASHEHDFRLFHENVLGYKSKRNDGQTNDVEWYEGDVKRCAACPAMLFVPHGGQLYSVAVDLAPAEELAKIWPPRPARAA